MVLIELRVIAANKKANKEEIEIRTAHLKTSQVTTVKYTLRETHVFGSISYQVSVPCHSEELCHLSLLDL